MLVLKKGEYTIYISEKKDGTAREIKWFTYSKQTHGNNIYLLERKEEGILSENDGILSKLTNIKIWVLLADCNGIIFMGKQWYGVIHAGRKWLTNGIIPKALAMLQKKKEKIEALKVYIGPSIRKCCYEVGEEFLWYFNSKHFERRDGKLYFDMTSTIIDLLLKAWMGKSNIEINKECTACSWKFFSYRKQNNNQRIVVGVRKSAKK